MPCARTPAHFESSARSSRWALSNTCYLIDPARFGSLPASTWPTSPRASAMSRRCACCLMSARGFGASVDFTPSFICSARAGRSLPRPTLQSRRWTGTTSSAWWSRMRRPSGPAGPISMTFGVAGETTPCAIRSMLGRKPSPDIARWAGGRVNKDRSREFRGRCRRCRSFARSAADGRGRCAAGFRQVSGGGC